MKRITCLGFKSDILIEESDLKTDKSIFCKIFRAEKNYKLFDEIWLPISQIEDRCYNEELKEECIDVAQWYFVNVLFGSIDPDNNGQFSRMMM